MTFESTRQIIESRIFGAAVSTTSLRLETLTELATRAGVTESNITSLNSDIPTDILLKVTANSINGNNDEIKLAVFPAGVLLPSNTVADNLVFINSFGGTTAEVDLVGGRFLIVKASSNTLTASEKVAEWILAINTATDLGFTAEADVVGGNGIIIRGTGISIDDINLSTTQGFAANFSDVISEGTTIALDDNDTSFSVFLESRDFTQPVNGKWGVLFINDSAVVGREFGNTSGLRSSGSVRFKLYAPRNAGTRVVRSMADELNTLLNYTAGDTGTDAGGTLLMRPGSLTRVSDNEDGSISYNLDYIYDYYTST